MKAKTKTVNGRCIKKKKKREEPPRLPPPAVSQEVEARTPARAERTLRDNNEGIGPPRHKPSPCDRESASHDGAAPSGVGRAVTAARCPSPSSSSSVRGPVGGGADLVLALLRAPRRKVPQRVVPLPSDRCPARDLNLVSREGEAEPNIRQGNWALVPDLRKRWEGKKEREW